MSSNILFELGTEELPPTALSTLSQALTSSVELALKDASLSYDAVEPFASPRRLALVIHNLADTTPVTENKVWGPPKKVAFDGEGKPTKAALAFCERNGVEAEALQTESDGKVEKLVCTVTLGGEESEGLLPEIFTAALNALPIPKRMRWGSKRTEFVRPVHWLVLLKDADVIDCAILGLNAGRDTFGHRFLAPKAITLNNATEYAEALRSQGKVLPSFAERRDIIATQVKDVAQSLNGEAVIDDDLLDEVTALVEWPKAVSGSFDKDFLRVPGEALISSMKEHQKYFHVVNKSGELLPYFITVSNMEADDYSAIVQGNEKVIRPRLADAAFFFDTDKKVTQTARREKLHTVLFQAQLGSIYDKTSRLERLTQIILSQLGKAEALGQRAAALCKSDLVSNMVYEFPEMQGIAGYHYALNDGEDAVVAQAIKEHYLPKFAGDILPSSDEGIALALADRLDTITGIFGIGQLPTGSKDPFALRRASVGVLRLLVDTGWSLDLRELIKYAADGHQALTQREQVVDEVFNYIIDRFKASYSDQGIGSEVFQSVVVKALTVPTDIDARVKAVATFYQSSESVALAAANKRVANILAKNDACAHGQVNAGLLQQDEEKQLASTLSSLTKDIAPLIEQGNYADALSKLASLRAPVDAFFDNVMVMAEDEALQKNRIALLAQLRALFLDIADISYLAPAK